MPRRDLLDDAPLHQFIRDFASRLLADRAPCLHGCFTRQGRHLTALFRRELGRGSQSGRILQTLRYIERLEIDPLQSHPTIPPQAHGLHVQRQLAPNLRIGTPLRRRYRYFVDKGQAEL